MRRALTFIIVVVVGILLARSASCTEPSWYVFKSDSLEIHVPNIIRNVDSVMRLSEFAPAAGRAYAKRNHKNGDYLMIPVMVEDHVGGGIALDSQERFFVLVGKKKIEAVDAMWFDMTLYPRTPDRQGEPPTTQSLATFPKSFRLKDVTGFTFLLNGREYQLQRESKLR